MEQSLPNYFQQCNTPDEIKSHYRVLAMEHRPDRLGLNATEEARQEATRRMQEINRQYSVAMARAIRGQSPGISEEQAADAENIAETIRQAVEAIIHLPNLEIEIRGSWVWVFGETKAAKEQLKQAGYKWLPKKDGQPWAYMGVASRGSGQWSHEEIIDRYGRQTVRSRGAERLVGK